MKKLDKSVLENMAKEKNIDKGKIEKMANNYKDKSEDELMSELIKVGKGLEGKEEVVSKFKAFLDEDQQNKLDKVMQKISEAETNPKAKKVKPERKKPNTGTKKVSTNVKEDSKVSSSTKQSASTHSSTPKKSSSNRPKGLLGKMKKSSPK